MFLQCNPYINSITALEDIRRKCPELKIVVITARPAWKYSFLVYQTYKWLHYHGINTDLLLFNKDKADAVIDNLNVNNVIYFIEDRDKHAVEISNIGIDVLLIAKPYNENISDSNNLSKVYSWDTIKNKVIDKYHTIMNQRSDMNG